MAVTHSSSDTAILTIEKSFNWRGVREHWSNSYHMDNVPPSSTVWADLASQAWVQERLFLDSEVQFERATGHTPGTPPVLVYEQDVAPPGEGGAQGQYVPEAGRLKQTGDVAMWVRWGTTQKTSTGKPIYLRNYYHQVYTELDADAVAATQVSALQALGLAWKNGIVSSGVTYRRAGPRGAVAQNYAVGQYATTRTLKRRGRRTKPTVNPADARDVPVIIPGWLGNILDDVF